MTDEKEPKNDDFIKKIEEVAKSLGASVDKIDKKLDQKTAAIEAKLEKTEEKEDDIDEFSGPEKIAESVEKTVEERLERKFNDRAAYQAECAGWDAKAFSKFPQLKDKNSELSKAVEVELGKIYPIAQEKGKKILPPDAIYNAASRIAVDNPRFIQETVHEELEGGGNFERRIKGKAISEAAQEISSYYTRSYGLKPEKVKARYEGRKYS